MSKPSQQKQLRKIRKDKQRRKACILRKEETILSQKTTQAKVDKKFKKIQEKENKLFKGMSTPFSRMKVRLFNIFKNLFKTNATQQT